jgi:hypothetical protein
MAAQIDEEDDTRRQKWPALVLLEEDDTREMVALGSDLEWKMEMVRY